MGKNVQNSLALLITANSAEFNKKMDELGEKTNQTSKKAGSSFSTIVSAVTKVAGALGVAKLAQMGFNEALKANDSLADAFEVKMTQAKSATSSFFTTLTTGDFSNFKTNMEESVRLAKEYKQEMQALDDLKFGQKLVSASRAVEIAELKKQARYGETVKQREWATKRLKAVYAQEVKDKKYLYTQDYNALVKKIASETNLNENYIKNAITQYEAMYDLIGPEQIAKEFEQIDFWKKSAPDVYQNYLTDQQAALAPIKDIFDLAGGKLEELATKQLEINKIDEEFRNDLREILRYQQQITKETDKQLNNKKKAATTSPVATMDAQYNLMSDSAEMRNNAPQSKSASPIANPLPKIDFDSYISGSRNVVDQNKQMSESFNTMENDSAFLESAFATLGNTILNSFSQGEAGVESFVSTLLGSLQSVLVAELAKALAATISGSMQTSKNPIRGLALATASVAGVKALWDSNIPKYGNGGLVTSPTLAIVGEKGPERITPVGRGGSTSGVVELRLKGRDAVALVDLNKYYEQLA